MYQISKICKWQVKPTYGYNGVYELENSIMYSITFLCIYHFAQWQYTYQIISVIFHIADSYFVLHLIHRVLYNATAQIQNTIQSNIKDTKNKSSSSGLSVLKLHFSCKDFICLDSHVLNCKNVSFSIQIFYSKCSYSHAQ